MVNLGRFFFVLMVLEILAFGLIVGTIGFWATFGLWFLSAVTGGFLLQTQGLMNLEKGRAYLQQGRLPEESLFESLSLLAAGLLFVLPGFVSDLAALFLLIPKVRNKLKSWLLSKLNLKPGYTRPPGEGDIIEGEYVRVEDVQISSQSPRQQP